MKDVPTKAIPFFENIPVQASPSSFYVLGNKVRKKNKKTTNLKISEVGYPYYSLTEQEYGLPKSTSLIGKEMINILKFFISSKTGKQKINSP